MDSRMRLLAGLGLVVAAVAFSRSGGSGGAPTMPIGPPPKLVAGVPFAMGTSRPAWPVLTSSKSKWVVSYVDTSGKTHGNSERDFGAYRDDPDGDRHHVGIDVYGDAGDAVVAAEPGTIVKVRPTFNLGTGVLYLATDTGITLVYGEIAPNSWKDFGIVEGQRVTTGQKLARIGCQKHSGNVCTSHMIHFETYKGKVTSNEQWGYSKPAPPPSVLNPTLYLLRARAAAGVIA